jgi:uncharacterized protein (TIGR02996 family)
MLCLATTHPEADAFVARVLTQPDDRLNRLVFADWLDETGIDHLAAWAEYIRLRAAFAESGDEAFRKRADEVGCDVRARLTLHTLPGLKHLRWLPDLLPDHRIQLRIGDDEIPHALVECLPESVSREHLVMPVALHGATIYLMSPNAEPPVIPEPSSFDDLRTRMAFILNKDVVLFRGDADDIQWAIERHYGQSETESIDSAPLLMLPPIHPFGGDRGSSDR